MSKPGMERPNLVPRSFTKVNSTILGRKKHVAIKEIPETARFLVVVYADIKVAVGMREEQGTIAKGQIRGL